MSFCQSDEVVFSRQSLFFFTGYRFLVAGEEACVFENSGHPFERTAIWRATILAAHPSGLWHTHIQSFTYVDNQFFVPESGVHRYYLYKLQVSKSLHNLTIFALLCALVFVLWFFKWRPQCLNPVVHGSNFTTIPRAPAHAPFIPAHDQNSTHHRQTR